MSELIDISIDLETIGTGSCAGIIALGAVRFDRNKTCQKFTDPRDRFYVNFDIERTFRQGLCDTSDIKAFSFWLSQPKEAQEALLSKPERLKDGLRQFAHWIREVHWGRSIAADVRVWGNGNTFDNVILRNAYDAVKVRVPWGWKQDMDMRTLMHVAEQMMHLPVIPRVGTHHNALDDAMYQANKIQAVLTRLDRLANP